uniref:Uncharacterized protein n=1 Tax=Arundo donax TaxID=35708 RepID=A0A0A9EUZ8_ARUDO
MVLEYNRILDSPWESGVSCSQSAPHQTQLGSLKLIPWASRPRMRSRSNREKRHPQKNVIRQWKD